MEYYILLSTMSTALTARKTCDYRSNRSVKPVHVTWLKRVCEAILILICEDLVLTTDCVEFDGKRYLTCPEEMLVTNRSCSGHQITAPQARDGRCALKWRPSLEICT